MKSESPAAPANAYAVAGLAIGLAGLGLLSVIYQDLALQWQPVPQGLPARSVLGVLSGLILLAAAGLLVFRPTLYKGAALASAFIGLWVLGLHAPVVAAQPGNVAAWLGLAECLEMSTGAFLLFCASRPRATTLPDPAVRPALFVFGLTLVVFGLSHFVYADFTAQMVPGWLPMPLALAYLTGAIHTLAGVCLLIGRWMRAAVMIEASMMTSFVLLVHIPRVAAQPTNRTELTLMFVAIVLSSSAWIAASIGGARRRSVRASSVI